MCFSNNKRVYLNQNRIIIPYLIKLLYFIFPSLNLQPWCFFHKRISIRTGFPRATLWSQSLTQIITHFVGQKTFLKRKITSVKVFVFVIECLCGQLRQFGFFGDWVEKPFVPSVIKCIEDISIGDSFTCDNLYSHCMIKL